MKPKQFARLRLGTARRISAGLTDHEHPSVSPDPRLIAYYSGEYGAISIAVCGLDGRLARIVSPHGGNNTQPAWRPDGLAVAYRHQHDPGSKWELWVTELGGENLAPRQLLANSKWHYKHPSYSPDGKTLAYFSNEDSDSNAYHIWLWDLASGTRRQVTFGNTQMHCHPVFSPDGTRIAYHAYEGTDEDSVPAVTNLYELDLSTNEVRELTLARDQYKHPFYLDDNVIVYHHERNSDGLRWIEALHLGTRETVQLTDGSCNDKHPFPFWRQGEPWLTWSSKKLGPELALEDKSYDIFIAPLLTDKQKTKKGRRKK
jgi:TolB protein